MFAALWMAQLRKRLRLDLAYSLPCHTKSAAHLFKGAWTTVVKTEPQPDDLLFSRRKFAKNLRYLNTQHLSRGGIGRSNGL